MANKDLTKSILSIATSFTDEQEKVTQRRNIWINFKVLELSNQLNDLATTIKNSSVYFQNSSLYVRKVNTNLSASINKRLENSDLVSVILMQGTSPITSFKSISDSEYSVIAERGFQLIFTPQYNFMIGVTFWSAEVEGGQSAQSTFLGFFSPEELGEEKVQELLLKALKLARENSYLFTGLLDYIK